MPEQENNKRRFSFNLDFSKRLEELRRLTSGISNSSSLRRRWNEVSNDQKYTVWYSLSSQTQKELFLSLPESDRQNILDQLPATAKLKLLQSMNYSEYLQHPFIIDSPVEVSDPNKLQARWNIINKEEHYLVWLSLTAQEQKALFLSLTPEDQEGILHTLSPLERKELLSAMTYIDYLQYPFMVDTSKED